MLYLGFSLQIEEQNVRKLHNFFRNTDICRLDCTQVQSGPASCVREWPAPDALQKVQEHLTGHVSTSGENIALICSYCCCYL